MEYLSYSETPVVELAHPISAAAGIRLLVKREDLNHERVSGNKWWKLKYNILEALSKGHKRILTFGGAYSNHIHATAAAASAAGLESIGVIRGEEHQQLNETLSDARQYGMLLHYVSRTDYRKKNERGFNEAIEAAYGPFYLIPEGGTNDLAVAGTAELGSKLLRLPFDFLFTAVGTGGTVAGIICAFKGERKILGVPVLKGGASLGEHISSLLHNAGMGAFDNWELLTHYHFGGYAKTTKELIHFMDNVKHEHNLPLDHVYTAKAFFCLLSEIKNGRIPRGSTVLFLHTGGLQGLRGLSPG